MTKITIDASTAAKLKGFRELVELRDESGYMVGHFLPGPPRDEFGRMIVPYTDEEIEELSKQSGGRPLKEILDDLSKL